MRFSILALLGAKMAFAAIPEQVSEMFVFTYNKDRKHNQSIQKNKCI